MDGRFHRVSSTSGYSDRAAFLFWSLVEVVMKRTMIILTGLALMCSIAGCSGYSDEEESVFKEFVDIAVDVPTVMKGITDGASARAAKPRFEKYSERLPELLRQMSAMPESHRNALATKHKETIQQARNDFVEQMRDKVIMGKNVQGDDAVALLTKFGFLFAGPMESTSP